MIQQPRTAGPDGPGARDRIESQRPLNEGWLLSEQRHLADDSTAISYRALASMIEGKAS